MWAVLGQTPGVRMRGYDVGGSHKSQQTSYESFGYPPAEPRALRRCRLNRRHERHGLLLRLLLDRGVHDVGRWRGRRDDVAGLSHRHDDEERRKRVLGPLSRRLRRTRASSRTTSIKSSSTAASPATPTSCSTRSTRTRAGRSSRTKPGSTASTTTSRSTNRSRASTRASRPTSATSISSGANSRSSSAIGISSSATASGSSKRSPTAASPR